MFFLYVLCQLVRPI